MTGAAESAPPRGLKLWVAGARPRTLPAAIVPVLVGTACAAGVVHASYAALDGGTADAFRVRATAELANLPVAADLGGGATKGIIIWRFVAAMIVALAIQIGTNYANDYSDGVRGTDNEDRVGPIRLVGSGLA